MARTGLESWQVSDRIGRMDALGHPSSSKLTTYATRTDQTYGSLAARTEVAISSTRTPSKAPVQLVSTGRGKKYEMTEDAKAFLANFKRPLVVVAIVGKYRSGKSFLLNALSDMLGSDGFKISSASRGCTRGIWGYGLPEKINGRTVLLLDTEGLFESDKDEEDMVSLFTLALLSSSLLIYNTQGGAIDSQQLMNLAYVAKVTENIDMGDESNGNAIHTLFPSLLWLLRDSTLDLEADHLEKVLAASSYGLKKQEAQLNRTKDVIKRYFPDRQFMAMDRPTTSRDALKDPRQGDLCTSFLEQLDILKTIVFAMAPVKEVSTRGGSVRQELDGPGLCAYMESVVDALNNSELVSMSSVWTAVLRSEMQRTLDAALEAYERHMTGAEPRMPMSESELLQIHAEATWAARQKLRASDPELRAEFLNKFEDAVGLQSKSGVQRGLFLRFVRLNEEKSQRFCDDVIAAEKAALHDLFTQRTTTPASFAAEVRAAQSRLATSLKGPKAAPAMQLFKNFCVDKERELVAKVNEAALAAACRVLRGLVAEDAFVEVKAFEERKATEAAALRAALIGDQAPMLLAKFEESCIDMLKNVSSKVEARQKQAEQARQHAELDRKLQSEQRERERVAKLAESERRAKAESEARLREEEQRRREEEGRNRELQRQMVEAKAAEERANREAEASRAEVERKGREMREARERAEEEREERRKAEERERQERQRELARMSTRMYEPSFFSSSCSPCSDFLAPLPTYSSPSPSRSSAQPRSSSSSSERFYSGGQFVPGGGRAPAGGIYMSSSSSSSSFRRSSGSSSSSHGSSGSSSSGGHFYKGGQFMPGGGRAPKGGAWG